MEWIVAFVQISSMVTIAGVLVLFASVLITTVVWSIAGYGIQALRATVPAILRHAAQRTQEPRRKVYHSLSHDIVRAHKLKTS